MRIESTPPPSDYSQGPSGQAVIAAALAMGNGLIYTSQNGLPPMPAVEQQEYNLLNQAASSNPNLGAALKQYSDLMQQMQNGTADLGPIKTLFECVSSFVEPTSLTSSQALQMGSAWLADASTNAYNMQYGASPTTLKNSLDQCCTFLNQGGAQESISLLTPAYTTVDMILKGQLDPTNNAVIGEIISHINCANFAIPPH